MNNSVLEYTAEDLIAHKLQRSGILVAKPKFDMIGADLLAFLGVEDGAKFCRIQCKGRSLKEDGRSQVTVPCDYVTDGFILFLFLETGQIDETSLFCFFSIDIRENWQQAMEKEKPVFRLSLRYSDVNANLRKFEFNDDKIREIVNTIKGVNNIPDFKFLNDYRNYMTSEEGIIWPDYPGLYAEQIVSGLAKQTGESPKNVKRSLNKLKRYGEI